MQKDRGEILRALLVANGGKMLEKEARQKMHLSKSQFSQLLAAMQDHIEVNPYPLWISVKDNNVKIEIGGISLGQTIN